MDDITQFIKRLVDRIKTEKTFELIIKDLEIGKRTWDTVARKEIGKIVKEVFKESFPAEKDIGAIYIEGEGTPVSWRKPYPIFGSRGVYPDIGILRPKRIAIELDHSEIGRTEVPGSKFKIALAKASFGYMSGDWDYCFVLFHNNSGKLMESYLNGEKEKEILEIYKEKFHTQIVLFE